MRKALFLLLFSGAAVGAYLYYFQDSLLEESIVQYVENGDFLTLEAVMSPHDILLNHSSELKLDDQHIAKEPTLFFAPYLLLEIKHANNHKWTRENKILWSQLDGEMVLDTATWETSHGYKDAIDAKATRVNFKVMQALASHGGRMTRDQLQKALHLEKDQLDPWIQSTLKKHLIYENNGELFLHLENPRLPPNPQTKVSNTIVKRPYEGTKRLARHYSRRDIEQIAQAAFGPAFAIRDIQPFYLPVYCIEIQNPDGSTLCTYWNAITGTRIT